MQLIIAGGSTVVEAGIHLVVRTMIARHGEQAADNASNRARMLEACGDRDTSRYWDLVRERIDEVRQAPARRGGFFTDDDPDLAAVVRELAFGPSGESEGGDDFDKDDDEDEDEDEDGDDD